MDKHGYYHITWDGICRVFNMAEGSVRLDNFEINTLKYLYNQCDKTSQQFLRGNYKCVFDRIADATCPERCWPEYWA